MSIKIIRTNSTNKDFISLVKQLDAYLEIVDGEEHGFYNKYNTIDNLKNVVIIYANNVAVACGAFKKFNEETSEIKRMFVAKNFRRKGFAQKVLIELENWSKEQGYEKCILETGKTMNSAITFYLNNNYKNIPNFAQYKNIKTSICFEKQLIDEL